MRTAHRLAPSRELCQILCHLARPTKRLLSKQELTLVFIGTDDAAIARGAELDEVLSSVQRGIAAPLEGRGWRWGTLQGPGDRYLLRLDPPELKPVQRQFELVLKQFDRGPRRVVCELEDADFDRIEAVLEVNRRGFVSASVALRDRRWSVTVGASLGLDLGDKDTSPFVLPSLAQWAVAARPRLARPWTDAEAVRHVLGLPWGGDLKEAQLSLPSLDAAYRELTR